MKKYSASALLLLVLFIVSCNYIAGPHDVNPNITPVSDTTKRVALLEEWTGHFCLNCPDAANDIESLESTYGESFVAISIHDGFFAVPCPQAPVPPCVPANQPGAFTDNFICPTGASYSAAHPDGPQGPPTGMVNRIGMATGTELTNRGDWPGLVDHIVHQQACATLHVVPSYQTSTRRISVNVWGTWLQSYSGTVNIAVMLTESGMVGWQTGNNGCDPQFVFRNVLRECLNTPGSITGTQLSSGTSIPATTYSYTLPAPYTLPTGFNENNCNIVALIYDTTTGEVLQAGDAPLQ